jgi:hypothetical protein
MHAGQVIHLATLGDVKANLRFTVKSLSQEFQSSNYTHLTWIDYPSLPRYCAYPHFSTTATVEQERPGQSQPTKGLISLQFPALSQSQRRPWIRLSIVI